MCATNNITMKKRFLHLIIILVLSCTSIQAQNISVNCIRDAINGWQSLRGVALGEACGNLAWYGHNGYSYQDLRQNIIDVLLNIYKQQQRIDYISIANNGNYVFVHNNGGCWSALGSQDFYNALNDLLNSGGLRSATVNSSNQYFIVGKNGSIRTNVDNWRNFYNTEKQRLGNIKTAWCNDYAIVICFERGYSYYGQMPISVRNDLNGLDWAPDVIQFEKNGNVVAAQENGRYFYRLNNYSLMDYSQMTGNYPGGQTVAPAPVYPTPVYPTTNPCGVCNSTGRCSGCNGTGISPNHAPGIVAKCGYCGGSGRCATCGGKGYH